MADSEPSYEECLVTASITLPPGVTAKKWAMSKDDPARPSAIFINQPTMRTLTFPGDNGRAAVRIECGDPPKVWIDPDMAWDVAAKQFWNAVHRIIGQPAPWPDL